MDKQKKKNRIKKTGRFEVKLLTAIEVNVTKL